MPNTAERRHVGSEITQKQNKYEQANPETTCGIDEGTVSVLVHATSHLIVRVGNGGDGTWQDGNVGNEKYGVTSAEMKRNMDKRALRWLDK